MASRMSFSREIGNLLYAMEGSPIDRCVQCGTCSGTCPAAPFMDHSPRQIIDMVRAGLRKKVLSSNTFWYCASCYQCTVRCPQGIRITDLMYALKRYALWKGMVPKELIGPAFSQRFVQLILKYGRSFEPGLAWAYIFKLGFKGLMKEAKTGMKLFLKGRLPMLPSRIKRIRKLRRVLGRIVPIEGLS